MPPNPIPKRSFFDKCVRLGVFGGERRWRSQDGKQIYTWDSMHGEIEVFNRRGEHLGALDPICGLAIKSAVKGRTIDV